MINAFDKSIVTLLNQYVQKSWAFDEVMVFIHDSHLLKGGVLVAVLWLIWFREKRTASHRPIVLATLGASVAGLFVARALALTLPFRDRPMHDANLALRLPDSLVPATLDGWSSFPSDHAVLFFTLAIGIFWVSRTMGIMALLYTLAAICMPRIYLGLHYPTDILCGAVIGMCVFIVANARWSNALLIKPMMQLHERFPGLFYTCFFLVSYQIADMFDSSRSLASFTWKMVKALSGA